MSVGRQVGRAADLAGIPVLVLGVATRAFALDEAVREEHRLHRIVELLDRADVDEALFPEPVEHGLGQRPGLRRVGRIVVVERDVEAREIPQVLGVHALDEALGRDPLGLGLQHDRGAVGVVGAHVVAGMPREALETDPDVGLDVLDQVSQVDGAVGVGQRAGDEDLAGGVVHGVLARRRAGA